MRYVVVLEKSGEGVFAYVPDVLGCEAAGEDRDDAIDLIREALSFHLGFLRHIGKNTPVAETQVEVVEVEIVPVDID